MDNEDLQAFGDISVDIGKYHVVCVRNILSTFYIYEVAVA